MKFKQGVPQVECHPKLKTAETEFENIFFNFWKEEPTCTSTTDGKHMRSSKHYKTPHEARDYRLPTKLREFLWEIQTVLGKEFDFILEKDHFHLEIK